MPALPRDLGDQVRAALAEDIGSGDVTAALVPAAQQVRGRAITREAAVLCGVAWVTETFRQLDPAVQLSWQVSDGATVSPEQVLFEIEGPARAVLTGERTALNFLQLLSGVATVARTFADAVAGTANWTSVSSTRATGWAKVRSRLHRDIPRAGHCSPDEPLTRP